MFQDVPGARVVPEVVKKVEDLQGVNHLDLALNSFQTLQWRDAIKACQWERLDASQGVGRQCAHQVARKALAQHPLQQGRHKQFAKSRRLCAKLSMDNIVANLETDCHCGARVHHCLQPFRAVPSVVLRWRKCWYALPKANREQRLWCTFAGALGRRTEDQLGDSSGFMMEFLFLGEHVCRQAFILLTGICAETLQQARSSGGGKRGPFSVPPPTHNTAVFLEGPSFLIASSL